MHKTIDQIDAICKHVEKGPSIEFKLVQVKSMLLSKFNEARSVGPVVKNDLMKRWVCEIKSQLNFDPVNCSNMFIEKFKKDNKITSRKITHFVSKNKLKDHDQLVNKSTEFTSRINFLIESKEFETDFIGIYGGQFAG